MSKSKPHQSKKQQLFDPDEMSTSISQAVVRDLEHLSHVYRDSLTPSLEIGIDRQSKELLKKYVRQDLDKTSLEDQTFQGFLETNDHMSTTNNRLFSELNAIRGRLQTSDSRMEKIHKRARALMCSVLSPFGYDEWFHECKNSHGSSLGVSYQDTSPEKKFTFPLTVTKRCRNLFNLYMAYDESLKTAIINHNRNNPVMDPYEIVEGSRATTVDKTSEKRRMICIEPTCNMFLQQGLMQMMYNRMKKFGLDVESLPELHKQLALESSITCSNATIDWSSASDCVSLVLLKWLLPDQWWDAVFMTRSDTTSISGNNVTLSMLSTMGNAVTFPLETLVFWTYAHAVYLTDFTDSNTLYPNPDNWGMISVFGDDCIVPSYMASNFIEVMTEVGFIVNSEKSCIGPMQFRESCGGDYHAGFDVRPYFLKAPHSTRISSLESWLYIVGNSLLKKYMVYFGETCYVYDKNLWRLLFSLFSRYKIDIRLVPAHFPDDAGLKISHDIQRFKRHYRLRLSRIDKGEHGTISFSYKRFVYRKRFKVNDELRFAIKAKSLRDYDGSYFYRTNQLPIVTRERQMFFSNRRIGGYVVAKGITSHWDVPSVVDGG